jgi:hypothetical protein
MTNFYTSGLYSEPFYKRINDLVFEEDYMFDTICDDYNAFYRHYKNQIEQLKQPKNTDRYLFICNSIYELVILEISKKCLYFKPLIFKPDIALECGLIPLTAPNIRINKNNLYRSCKNYINVLILPSGTQDNIQIMDLSPRLDCYQALADNSIDEASYYFKDEEYFKSVVGQRLTDKVSFAISNRENN